MGVAGSGKTSVGIALSRKLGWTFLEADDFHTPENKAKMHKGIPLSDADREPWLDRIHAELLRITGAGENVVLACSALKAHYRKRLSDGLEFTVVYLTGTPELLAERLRDRKGHYAGESLLASQLETLEEPDATDTFEVSAPIETLVEDILRRKGLIPRSAAE